jgi:hypothetical protein
MPAFSFLVYFAPARQSLTFEVGDTQEVRVCQEPLEQREAPLLVARDQRLALALLPAVAVGGRRARLDLAVVAPVAGARTLRAAAQVADESAGAALEDVLGDVVVARPGEAARVVGAEDVEGRLVGARAQREHQVGEQEVARVAEANGVGETAVAVSNRKKKLLLLGGPQ